MITLEIYFKQHTKQDGTKFSKEYTCAFGFEMQIVFAKGAAQQLKFKGQDGKWYIKYDPTKASLKVDNGYVKLVVGI